eukprot:TRINITY_DN108718_c0_g1_i1.p1 TRINITY_DN108718_c0_g1~~TRINITY_DN108718_c0_g1_i1.p1  ORF type:complete len:442 (+),score=120.94 TRINITY_DN108718_c0_g1_i1:81-1406(+)
MASSLEVGLQLQAQYSVDGCFYKATVTQISEAKKRAKAPVKVKFMGYDEEEWKSLKELKSKRLTSGAAVEKKERAPKPLPEGPGGLCIAGESLIDMVPRETADGKSCYLPCLGGAPFNALLAAARLGIQTSYLATLSSDMFGEELYQHLKKEGINLDFVQRLDQPTTLAFVSRKPGEGERYAFFKENAADRQLTSKRVKEVLAKNRFDMVNMSLGAVTLEDKTMAAAFTELFRGAGKHGTLRTFDPNLRSNMIKGTANSYRKLIESFIRHCDVVKSSDDDIAYLYGEDSKFQTVAKKWLSMGPKLVIVTCGSKGAIGFPKDIEQEITMPPPGTQPNTVDASGKSAPVIDTVGAGDTFMGSMIQGLMGTRSYEFSKEAPLLEQLKKGKAWDEASVAHLRDVMERAALAAAINCSRTGCSPPSSKEVLEAGSALGLAFVKAAA